MKESGINYFYSTPLGLPTGQFAVLYTFESGGLATNVVSVSGGQPIYSGTLSSSATFWDKPGSGHFSGTTVSINNGSGGQSESWTKIFVYEKVDVNPCVLFNSLTGGSGHRIGLTSSNKPYFESFNQQPVVAASSNNLSSKNAISVSYFTNQVTFGLFNFNSQTLEVESFSYPFQVTRSDVWTLGGQFTGYMDYYIHLTQYQSPTVIGQLLSGLYAIPTGIGYQTTTACVTGITGYQNVFVGQTGVTGYLVTPGGDEGRDYYTGAFPLYHTTTNLTGYLSSGIYASGITGQVCSIITGDSTVLFNLLTGYALSFGMQKVQLFTPLISTDVVKSSWDTTPFSDVYNRVGQRSYSGYLMADSYPTGLLDIFFNGIGQANSGWYVTGSYIVVSGATVIDDVFWDLKSGDKRMFSVAVGQTGFNFTYSGQEIYLNGVNLVSGFDYTVTGGFVNLRGQSTGINGVIFEYPVVLPFRTGLSPLITGRSFQRDTSNEYLNGVRQQINSFYVEGAIFDLLSGNAFTYSGVQTIYDNNDNYWEAS